jgi:hypothetical protein
MKVVSHSKVFLLDTNLLLLSFIGAKDTNLISKVRTLKAFEESDYDLSLEVINDSFNSDGLAPFNANNDLVINVTGITGTIATGALTPTNYFVI